MKICIKEDEFNPSLLYQNWCSEESAINMGYTIIEIEDQYKDCDYQDFNEDLTFSVEKYNARKQRENERLYVDNIVAKIRLRYSINDELAILRQAITKPEEYQEYYDYVEQCKAEVKNNIH